MADIFTSTTSQQPTPTAADPNKATSSFNLSGLAGSTDTSVDPKTQTVGGQLESLIASDSPLMQQARSRAQQTMNARGMTNSSLATSAGDAAMYDAAMPIAQANASTMYDANKTSTAAQNQFNLNNNAVAGDIAKLNVQTGAAKDVAGIEAQYKNLTQGSASSTAILGKMQDSLNALAANKDITDANVRNAMTADIKRNAAESLNLVGAIAGDVDLSSYISQVGL
jgi:hypothetical protein